MNIGIALSGGGVRALIFHLGVLKRIAEENQLKDVTQISSVSGGSLGIGLILSVNNYKWPSSDTYLNTIIPKINSILTSKRFQRSLFWHSLFKGRLFTAKGLSLASAIKNKWSVSGKFGDLSQTPMWWVNATNYETGVNWRFSQESVGDYLYSRNKSTSEIPISIAPDSVIES